MYPSQGNLTITVLHSMRELIESIYIVESPPTNMSAMVKFITKYMPRVRRLLFVMKRMIHRRFTVTIVTETVRNAANQLMHSDVESIVDNFFSLTTFSCSATCTKMNSSKGCLVGKETLGGELKRMTSSPPRSVMETH